MTNALYMKDSYLKEFDATVENVKDGKYIVLDQTAFYPRSGGQPHDTGKFVRKSDGEEFEVIFTGKFSGQISHEVAEEGLEEGDEIHGEIDWGRRYRFMRMHTACHVISAMVHEETGAKITGNKIKEDETRIDFGLDDFDKDLIRECVERANKKMKEGIPVEIKSMPRDEALELVKLADSLPPNVDPLRIVKIGDVDVQPGGGTHVKNTEEVGEVEIVKFKNKGRDNRRVYFTLKD